MKQVLIVLILLFVYTVQKEIHTESSKDEKSNRGSTHLHSIFKEKCPSGYVFDCREVAANKDTLKPITRCRCIKEKKVGISPNKKVDLTSRATTEKFKPRDPASSTTKNIKCPKGYTYTLDTEFDFKTGLHFKGRCKKISKDKTTKLSSTKIGKPLKTKKCEEGYYYYCEPIKGMYMHYNMPERKCYCKKKEEQN